MEKLPPSLPLSMQASKAVKATIVGNEKYLFGDNFGFT